MIAALSLFALLALIATVHCEADHGLPESIDWVTNLDAAKAKAEAENKPMMALLWKSCACKSLKRQLADNHAALEAASKDFVMVSLGDDDEPQGEEWKPDGGYIPRVLFLDSKGELHPEIKNTQGSPKYGYFYSTEDHLVTAMKEAKKVL